MSLPMRQDAYERRRIERISEADFWSAWTGRDRHLRQAIALAGAGRGRQAYLALAGLHRRRLAEEYQFVRRQAQERNADPRTRRATFQGAEDVRRGRIRGWFDQTIAFSRRIDFNANFGQSGQYGFHYLFWLTPLIDRFLLEGDPADLARVLEIVRQYYDQRTGIKRRIPALHPVYYELGAWAKTQNLLPAYLALVNQDRLAAGDVEAFLKLFLGLARSLNRLQRSGYRPGNWQIVGCAGLYRLGALFVQLREAPQWRKTALAMMQAHLRRDFFSDGGHKEQCWSYGWMSLKGVMDLYQTGRRTGLLPPAAQAAFLRAIRRALDWFVGTITPSGVCPAYGDGDLVGADDILAAARQYLPQGKAADKARRVPVCLRPSGYAVMRDDGSRDSRYLNVNFGPTGGGHTHQDLLDFNVWAFGQPLLEEVGRFSSYDHPLNCFFRSPEAHNQVVIEHHPMRRDQAAARDVVWRSTPRSDYFAAWHEAFKDERSGRNTVARIHRHILFQRGRYWFVYDLVEPAGETIFTVSSYLHAVRPFEILSPGQARVTGRPGCLVCLAHPKELKRFQTGVDVADSEVTAERLYRPRYFLQARTWASIGYRGCLRFAMLIYPFRDGPPRSLSSRLPSPGRPPVCGKHSRSARRRGAPESSLTGPGAGGSAFRISARADNGPPAGEKVRRATASTPPAPPRRG